MIRSSDHLLTHIGSTRGPAGKRTVFYGWCSCGWGTTHSQNPASVRRKQREHAARTHEAERRAGIA